jgi:hypothetical protein
VGATSTGIEIRRPSTSVSVEIVPTSTSTRGRSRQRRKAAQLSRSVCSSAEPPEM